jgi:hypothetical protein
MAARTMTQLVEGQPARLDVGESLPCRVIGFSGPEVVLRLSDDIRLGQRRVFSRAPIPLPVTVRRADGAAEWTTTTRDVSAGGVCVGREGADPGAGPLELTITVASHAVVAEGRVMRVTGDDVGVQFERIEDADRLLLASLALAYHRPR